MRKTKGEIKRSRAAKRGWATRARRASTEAIKKQQAREDTDRALERLYQTPEPESLTLTLTPSAELLIGDYGGLIRCGEPGCFCAGNPKYRDARPQVQAAPSRTRSDDVPTWAGREPSSVGAYTREFDRRR